MRKKSLIQYLLIVCIAMAPLLTVDAGDTGHMANMMENCDECDMSGGGGHDACDNTRCMLSSGICATQAGAAFITAYFGAPDPVSPLAENRHSASTRFRSRLSSSIYRPPIS